MAKKSKYYIYGFEEGKDTAYQTDWEPGEMLKKYERDELGEVVGQILENWQQMAGTIYYEGLSSSTLDKFEEGFYEGFVEGVEEQLKEGKVIRGYEVKINPVGKWFIFHSGDSWYIGQEGTGKTKRIGRVGGPRGLGRGLNYYDRAKEEASSRNEKLGFGYEAHIGYPSQL
jgi:hypothetical protein